MLSGRLRRADEGSYNFLSIRAGGAPRIVVNTTRPGRIADVNHCHPLRTRSPEFAVSLANPVRWRRVSPKQNTRP